MKTLTFVLSILFLLSCGKSEDNTVSKNAENSAKGETDENITFYKVNGKAILLGDSIKLLDNNFKEIKNISFLNEQLVEITEVSNKYHKSKSTDDYCQEFKYVKIKTKDLEGYVDGRKLYELIKTTQNKVVKIGNQEVSFIETTNFGIGVSNEDGLTGCSIHTPVVFSDKRTSYEGLVKMVKNKNYESNYPYFELKADSGSNDEILSVDKKDDRYFVKIKRSYQEGGAHLLVSIYKDNSGAFVAEILENETTED